MKHKFHGEWSSFVVKKVDGQLFMRRDGDVFLRIPDDSTGDVQTGSNVNGKPLTGRAAPNGSSIELVQDDAARTRTYKGLHVNELNVGGQKVMVICGEVVNVDKPMAAEGRAKDEDKDKDGEVAAGDQEQGTWIATKP